MASAIELRGITKRFPGVVANDEVELIVEAGTIHAICGENGAGKSTLMKILYGMQAPDEGTMHVNGTQVEFKSPSEAIDHGIGMVHQHFMLADQLSVLENVIIGGEPMKPGGRIDTDAAEKHLDEVAAAYGLDLDPDELVEHLEVGERQRVEIIKALFRGARILILDEPTAVLVPQEVDELFRNMRELKASGATILFIDHKLDEVLEISDAITVLRQGKTVATVKPADVTTQDLAELMVGSELPSPETTDSTVTTDVALSVSNLTVTVDDRPVVKDLSLEVHRGEVLGIAGVEGNGQLEMIESVLGTRAIAAGTIIIDGTDVTAMSVRDRRKLGLAYVPADRHREGLLLDSPLWENAALGHQTGPPYAHGPWMDRDGAHRATEEIRTNFDVRTPNVDVSARALSGGNQQKLIIGREMNSNPKVLIAAHPTRGVDVGAQAAIWDNIRQARADGLATVLISADLDELIGLSDTIAVMFRGKIVGHVDPAATSPRELGAYMTGGTLEVKDQ